MKKENCCGKKTIRGIDEKSDKVESIGIEYSKQSLNDADLILFVYDASQGINAEDKAILELVKNKNYIILANKADIASTDINDAIPISALTGDGIESLKQALTSKVCEIDPENIEFVTNSRQQGCLTKAKSSLEQALMAAQIHELQDLISIDVKSSILALDELTGELITDDILDNIFEHFCIGK